MPLDGSWELNVWYLLYSEFHGILYVYMKLTKNDCIVTKLTALHLHMKQPDQKKMDVSS